MKYKIFKINKQKLKKTKTKQKTHQFKGNEARAT